MTHRFLWLLTLGVVAGTLSCSDPVPPASAAALDIRIGVCPAQTPTVTLGAVPPGNPVFSGENGASVTCKVNSSGEFFGVVSNRNLTFNVPEGSVDPETGVGTATVRLNAGGIVTSVAQPFEATDAPCTVQVVRTSQGLQLVDGDIWATFSCSNLRAAPSIRCTASGQFTFQRCKD